MISNLFFKGIYMAGIVFLFLMSCRTVSKLNKEDLSEGFKKNDNNLSAEYEVFHISSDSSRIYFRVPVKSLLMINNGQQFTSRMQFNYALFPTYNTTTILDSGSIYLEISIADSLNIYEGYFSMQASDGVKAILKITLIDLNRNNKYLQIVPFNKSNISIRQNYLLTDEENIPCLHDYVNPGKEFNIIPRDTTERTIYVRCHFRKYPMAAPPFKVSPDPVFNYLPDSTYSISSKQLQGLTLKRYGIYHFQNDTTTKFGFTVFCFDHEYPVIRKAEELIEPTRYLTTRAEYSELINAKDKRAAIDKFWLNLGGNKENARNLIREYYTRVQEANDNFTSYTEGWKTDRGLIYIIFGQPQSVYRNDETENWTYTPGVSLPDVNFIFKKTGNPFTDNDYSLIRESFLESTWYMNVEKWRQGRIFTND